MEFTSNLARCRETKTLRLQTIVILILQLVLKVSSQVECPLEGTHWSQRQSKCVAYERTSCSEMLGCTDNGICDSLFWTCFCKPGFSPSGPGLCLPTYESSCKHNSTELSCNSDLFLTCSPEEKCICDLNRRWNWERCVGLLGQKCDLKVTQDMTKASLCTGSARCLPLNVTMDDDPTQLREGTCQCPKGTRESEMGDSCVSSGANNLVKNVYLLLFMLTFPF